MSDETQCPFCGYANHKGHDCKAKERAAETIAELRKENERIRAANVEGTMWVDSMRSELAELRKENERLSASLQLVAQMGGLTLLGPSDSDYDGLTNRLPDQYWAHELGAARAFSQAAEVAKEALKEHGTL